MTPHAARILGTVLLGYTLALIPEWAAADDKPKPPDWSKYAYVTDLVGEIISADEKKITLRITWYVPQVQGGVNRRPPLVQNNRNFRNPYARNMNRPPRVTVKEQHHDYDLEFVPESLVRTKTLPPKYDDKGRRVNYTPKELEQLRQPPGVPGYAATVADLRPGTIAEVWVVRDKSIPAAKVTEDDLRVKYVLILSNNPLPLEPLPKGKD